MKFINRLEINTINEAYRGVENNIYIEEFEKKLSKKEYKQLFFEYTDDYMCGLEPDEKATFHNILPFYKHLKQIGCNCEMVWIDIYEHDSFYGIPITLLGFDIENEHVESVVLEATPRIQQYLNENGLCKTYEDALKVLELEKNRWTWFSKYLDIVYIYKLEI